MNRNYLFPFAACCILTAACTSNTEPAKSKAAVTAAKADVSPKTFEVGADQDMDGWNDEVDPCPEQPEDWQGISDGCPGTDDRDGDGIRDDVDACPDQAGELGYNGCPGGATEPSRQCGIMSTGTWPFCERVRVVESIGDDARWIEGCSGGERDWINGQIGPRCTVGFCATYWWGGSKYALVANLCHW